jgi:hypothetical protein
MSSWLRSRIGYGVASGVDGAPIVPCSTPLLADPSTLVGGKVSSEGDERSERSGRRDPGGGGVGCAAAGRSLEGSRYATRRVSGACKPPPDDDDPRDLVVNALSDTLLGLVRWDPDTRDLKEHLRDVIRRRTSADWDRVRKFPHQSIDAVPQDGTSPVQEEADRALRERLPDPRATEKAAEALAWLHQRAKDDPEVLALIRAKAQGATSRAEVMRLTGFSLQQYRAVRCRLNRIVAQLPFQVRPKHKIGD